MSLHGSCLSFPIRPDSRGTFATISDRGKIIEESIRSIIETRQGERVMMPDYGIPDFVFNAADGGFAARLGYFLKQQITRYEPLVGSVKVRQPSDASDQQRAVIIVEYVERGSNVPRNLTFPVWELLPSASKTAGA